jgi:hypothetical protein
MIRSTRPVIAGHAIRAMVDSLQLGARRIIVSAPGQKFWSAIRTDAELLCLSLAYTVPSPRSSEGVPQSSDEVNKGTRTR